MRHTALSTSFPVVGRHAPKCSGRGEGKPLVEIFHLYHTLAVDLQGLHRSEPVGKLGIVLDIQVVHGEWAVDLK